MIDDLIFPCRQDTIKQEILPDSQSVAIMKAVRNVKHVSIAFKGGDEIKRKRV